ncbi:MAG TPA: uL15m family ribosomal protein [Methanomassiliicoccales archaeon]|nr:uL15m family ribosomal protein [Methanomassiliicoccales archaeon]
MVSRTKRFRGSRTHGRGKKSGRGAGLHGGTGNAGLHKHKAQMMLKFMPDHFGRHGFKRPQEMVAAKITMNVGEVTERIDKLLADGIAQKKGDKMVVDLAKMGVDKLLGFGKVSGKYEIVVAESSETAKSKVESAGGAIVAPQ